jgi:ABC-type nickel/cobalt efflux system permease component RcnA
MKFATIILALLMLFSALAPCSDQASSEPTPQQDVELVQQDHAHQDAPGAEDHCLPFCSCHCCHSHVTFTNFFMSLHKEQPAVSYQFYLFQTPVTPAFNIWQPPKLA